MLNTMPFRKLRFGPSWPILTSVPSLRLWKKYLVIDHTHAS